MTNRARIALFLIGAAATLCAQTGTPAKLPEFEVATIKPVNPNGMHMGGISIFPGGRVAIGNASLKSLICTAFDVNYWQLSGGDDWTDKLTWNLEANPPESVRSAGPNLRHGLFTIEDETLRQMLQALLMERFQLKFHRETKTGTVYLLERNDKATLRLHPTQPASEDGPAPPNTFSSIGWAEKWGIYNTTMPQLAKFAGAFYMHATVLDRTNLTGPWDYTSPHEDPDPQRGEPLGSFQNMIRDIGLKLESAKGPVETLVIDHAEKPSPN